MMARDEQINLNEWPRVNGSPERPWVTSIGCKGCGITVFEIKVFGPLPKVELLMGDFEIVCASCGGTLLTSSLRPTPPVPAPKRL